MYRDDLKKKLELIDSESETLLTKRLEIQDELDRGLMLELVSSLRGTYWTVTSNIYGKATLTSEELGYDDVTEAISADHCYVSFDSLFSGGGTMGLSFSDGDWSMAGDISSILQFSIFYDLNLSTHKLLEKIKILKKEQGDIEVFLANFPIDLNV